MSEPTPIETAALLALADAGFDAYVCGSPVSTKGGVAVRVAPADPRVRWSSVRGDVAPLDHAFTASGVGFVLHAGRVDSAEDEPRIAGFVRALLASAARNRPASA